MGGYGTYLEIQSEGFWDLDGKLQAIGSETPTGRGIVDAALRAGARIVLSAILARVPVQSGAMKKALAIDTKVRSKPGRRTLAVGFWGKDLSSLTAATFTSGRTGKSTQLRYFYPMAVEYGHDVPYASAKRFERGERIARSKSQSMNLSADALNRMTGSMRAHRIRLAARGRTMDAALAATKKIPPHPFIRPAFEASASAAAEAITAATITGIQAVWSTPAGKAA